MNILLLVTMFTEAFKTINTIFKAIMLICVFVKKALLEYLTKLRSWEFDSSQRFVVQYSQNVSAKSVVKINRCKRL